MTIPNKRGSEMKYESAMCTHKMPPTTVRDGGYEDRSAGIRRDTGMRVNESSYLVGLLRLRRVPLQRHRRECNDSDERVDQVLQKDRCVLCRRCSRRPRAHDVVQQPKAIHHVDDDVVRWDDQRCDLHTHGHVVSHSRHRGK